MASPKLSLSRASDCAVWDTLVRRSPQGTLFSETQYLEATGRKHHLWLVNQGAEIKAGICVIVSADETRCELDDLVIYGGIIYDSDPNRQLVKRRHDEFQIAEFVAEQLAERYTSIDLTFSQNFQDMRPFQWYRYHDADVHKYALELRYTSHLDISPLRESAGREEDSRLFADMETVRRYSIREGRRKGGSVVAATSPDTLLDYYRTLMQRKGETQSDTKLEAMRRVIHVLLESGRGTVFHVVHENGALLYAVMYGWDSKRAYYLFGAGHREISTPWQGSVVHWEAFRYLAQRQGISTIDLEGVNSPRRGWFKLSFGGTLLPYYRVRKRDASQLG